MKKSLIVSIVFAMIFITSFAFAQPPRNGGTRFTPPKYTQSNRSAPPPSIKVHTPQRSYDRDYSSYRRSYHGYYDHGHHHHSVAPPVVRYNYPPVHVIMPPRPGVIVVPQPAIRYYPPVDYGYYGYPYGYGSSGFSFSVGGRNGSISIQSVR